MKIPKRVKVGAIPYAVETLARIECREHGQWRDRAGEHDGAEQVIRLARFLPIEQRWETFWHEVLHALDEGLPAKLKLGEDRIAQLAPDLNLFLIANGFVVVEPLSPSEDRAQKRAMIDVRNGIADDYRYTP